MKYKTLSSVRDVWFPRIKKIFINSFNDKCDVIFVTNEDIVYGFGDNFFAILGMKTEIKVTIPAVIEELCGEDIKKVVFGDRFMVALTESNEIYTGGLCRWGRCGNGIDSNTYCKPQKILIKDQSIVDICCGFGHTLILTDKQQVYIFGALYSDTTGLRFSEIWKATNSLILIPNLIRLFEKITSISCGYRHALALTQSGKVYSWGCNSHGELGLKHNNYEGHPKLVEMPNNISVKQISGGNDFSLLLTTEGNIYSFGNNSHGQLGLNNTNDVFIPTLVSNTSKITKILAFDLQSFAMNSFNFVEFWGQNITGETILSPQKTYINSLQDAILCTKYPFTIEPIILKNNSNEKPKESTKKVPSSRLMRTMAKGFNNPKNTDFRFKIKRIECDEPEKNSPSDVRNNKYEIIYCHKWFVEENCDYLKKMFDNQKSVNEIEIKVYSYETYFNFIQYLYTDSIETKDM